MVSGSLVTHFLISLLFRLDICPVLLLVIYFPWKSPHSPQRRTTAKGMNNGPEAHRFACVYVRNSNSRIRFNVFIGDPTFESDQHPTRYTFSVFCWSFLTMPSHRTHTHMHTVGHRPNEKGFCRRWWAEMGESHCSCMRVCECVCWKEFHLCQVFVTQQIRWYVKIYLSI